VKNARIPIPPISLGCLNYYQLLAPHPGRHAAKPRHKTASGNVMPQVEDAWRRIRATKDTGLGNLLLHGFAQDQIWCEITATACEALHDHADLAAGLTAWPAHRSTAAPLGSTMGELAFSPL